MEISELATSYFIRGLFLPHISGIYTSPSPILRFQELSLIQVEEKEKESQLNNHNNNNNNNNIEINQKVDQLRYLYTLDKQIYSLLDKYSLKKLFCSIESNISLSVRLSLISQLLDTLKLSTLSILAAQRNEFLLTNPLQTPVSCLHFFVGMLKEIYCVTDQEKKDQYFWMILNSLTEFFQVLKPFDHICDHTNNSIEILKNCENLLGYICTSLDGLVKMKMERIKTLERTETKYLFSQIRNINYSSPIVIPNASTNSGHYTIGFWMKIPKDYYQQFSNSEQIEETNKNIIISGEKDIPPDAIKTHILSRVPEAGEIDMTSLFRVSRKKWFIFDIFF